MLAKPLFQYIYYHDNDIRTALNLATEATQKCQFKDWWWKLQIGKCYYRLGLLRDAEKQLLSAIKQHQAIETYLHLAKVYVRLDQPLTAMEVYNGALEKFPGETSLLVGIARIHEGLNDLVTAVSYYKDVLQNDATNVEAIACLATHHFYSDQPEVAMRFYRRLLQMGVCNSEVFTNLGLCCFFAQQFDLAVVCFERALGLASEETKADIWYNISHIALGIGDMSLAYQCLRLALVLDNNHAEAYNNLAILDVKRGQINQSKVFFQTSAKLAPHLYEPLYNYAYLTEKVGDIQASCTAVNKALETFPSHTDSNSLLKRLKQKLSAL